VLLLTEATLTEGAREENGTRRGPRANVSVTTAQQKGENSPQRVRRKQMEGKTMENVTDAAINLAHLTHQVAKAKVLIDDVVDDGKRKVERTAKRGIVAMEDCIEDTTYFIKRHPWPSVGTALGLGTAMGMFVGWLTSRAFARNGQS
jgi:ElaB/YqjD/DUF883 family membrane-anchored ribosome-binding protein